MIDGHGFLGMYRERFIMALAQRYCDGQISWDEYVRTAETVQLVFDMIADELNELSPKHGISVDDAFESGP